MIPLSRPSITQAEKDAVTAVLDSGHLSLGQQVPAFEAAFQDFLQVRAAVAVSSGTAGLQLAVRGLNLPRGAEVITTPFTFIASASVLCHEGLKPVFCDIHPDTLNMDPADLARRVTPRTRALMVVHIFGLSADMAAIQALAGQHDLAVVEDACEALGADCQSKKVGTFGRSAVFAFYPNKQITTGEGGMIVTDEPAMAHTFRRLRNHGRPGRPMTFEEVGFNFRMDDMSAALGVVQMQRFPRILAKRRQVAAWYREALADVPGITCMGDEPGRSPFIFYVLFPDLEWRQRVINGLAENHIASGHYFPPLHLQKAFQALGHKKGDFPVCESIADRILAIPFWTDMPHAEVLNVSDCIKKIMKT